MSKIDLSSINKKYAKPIPEKPTIKESPRHSSKTAKLPPKTKRTKKKSQLNLKKELPQHPVQNDMQVTLSDIDRSKKIKLLELYVIQFPYELDKYKNKDFSKCTDQELIELKKQFDKQVSTKNNLHWGVSASQQALHIYEMLCKMSGLEVEGISKLGYDENWIKNVKAICLKYLDGGITTIEPEHQLLLMLLQNTLTLHYLNSSTPQKSGAEDPTPQKRGAEQLTSETNTEINNINHEFTDL
jgi:hypothetical protein